MPITFDSKKTVTEQLTTLEAVDRSRLKALAIEKTLGDKFSFTQDGYSISITGLKAVDDTIEYFVTATKDGKSLDLSNPFIVKNPPIAILSEPVTPSYDALGQKIMTRTENISQAFKDSLIHTIKQIVK